MVVNTGLADAQRLRQVSIAETLVAILLNKGSSQLNQTAMGGYVFLWGILNNIKPCDKCRLAENVYRYFISKRR